MVVRRSLRSKLYLLTVPLVALLLGMDLLFVVPLFNIARAPDSLMDGIRRVTQYEKLSRLLARQSADFTDFLATDAEEEANQALQEEKEITATIQEMLATSKAEGRESILLEHFAADYARASGVVRGAIQVPGNGEQKAPAKTDP
jgi:hypothetical protein